MEQLEYRHHIYPRKLSTILGGRMSLELRISSAPLAKLILKST